MFRNVVRIIESQQVESLRIFKRLAMSLIGLCASAGMSELLIVAHTTLFEMCIVFHTGKFHMPFSKMDVFKNNLSGYQSIK